MLMHNSQYSLLPELCYYIWHYTEILKNLNFYEIGETWGLVSDHT